MTNPNKSDSPPSPEITITDRGPKPEWHKDRSLYSPWWGRYLARYQVPGRLPVEAWGQDHADALRRLGSEVSVSDRRNDAARTYRSPPHHAAADARSLAAIILGRPELTGEGPWQEAIPGGQRTVSAEHAGEGRPF